MAFSIRITGVPREADDTTWTADAVSWWDPRALMPVPRFRPLERSPGFEDYVGVLSKDEASELARAFAGNAHPWQQAAADELELALDERDFRVVLVEIIEWSSGLD